MDSIIFDVDGTLWDSTPIVAQSWTNVIARETDFQMEITSDKLHQLFGKLLSDIAKSIFPNESDKRQQELIDLCCQEEHKDLLAQGCPTYRGLEDVLKTLHKKYKLYIVSNCQAGYIEVFLTATGLGKYFSGHLCPGDTGFAKAANISKIVKDNHLTSPVYVGDTSGDHKACKEAGVPFVFASYGFGQVEHPDYTIDQLSDLLVLFS